MDYIVPTYLESYLGSINIPKVGNYLALNGGSSGLRESLARILSTRIRFPGPPPNNKEVLMKTEVIRVSLRDIAVRKGTVARVSKVERPKKGKGSYKRDNRKFELETLR